MIWGGAWAAVVAVLVTVLWYYLRVIRREAASEQPGGVTRTRQRRHLR